MKIEKIINNVDASMAMENMLLTDENSEMLRVCLECKVLFKAIHEKLL